MVPGPPQALREGLLILPGGLWEAEQSPADISRCSWHRLGCCAHELLAPVPSDFPEMLSLWGDWGWMGVCGGKRRVRSGRGILCSPLVLTLVPSCPSREGSPALLQAGSLLRAPDFLVQALPLESILAASSSLVQGELPHLPWATPWASDYPRGGQRGCLSFLLCLLGFRIGPLGGEMRQSLVW